VMYHCDSSGNAHSTIANGTVTCIRGARIRYTCPTCNITQNVGDYVMPKGHTWDDNYVCTDCGHVGVDINDGTIDFGHVDNPRQSTTVPKYYYRVGGVRPSTHVTFDGRTALTWSNDANLNSDGTMKDLYIHWTNDRGIGKAYVNFRGKGNYYGTAKLEYIIVPNDVKNLRVSVVTSSAITTSEAIATATLTWDTALGAGYYRVYSLNEDGSRTLLGNTSATTFTVEDLVLGDGVTYKFEVASSAISTDGENKVYNCAKWSDTVIVSEEFVGVEEKEESSSGSSGNSPSSGGSAGSSGGGGGFVSGGFVSGSEDTAVEGDSVPGDGTCTGGKECVAFHFWDVSPIQWYHHPIDYVVAKGLMNGISRFKFEPNAPTTRAMIWTILARMEGVDTTPAAGEAWYIPGQKWAMENGISDGTNPIAQITREQLATMLWRYAGEIDSSHDISGYHDDHHVSDWAMDGLQWANETGIVTGMGDNTLAPKESATRAQIATIISRYCAQ